MKRLGTTLHVALPGCDLRFARWVRGSPGLGNLLFPWARCVAASANTGLPMLWPTWRQITLGPLVRGEPARFYGNLFSPSARYIRALRKERILRLWKRVPEGLLETALSEGAETIVEFRGMDQYFGSILGNYNLVRSRLLEIAREQHKPPDVPRSSHVAVHVRLGDFSALQDAKDLDIQNGRMNFRIPIEWYVYVVRLLREALETELPVIIFSDGPDAELAPLLALDGTTRGGGQSALMDLLSLAMSSVLVASGSTYSMWASYLGRMPVVWPRGQLRQRLYLDRPEGEAEIALGESFGTEFLTDLRRMAADEHLVGRIHG